MNCHLASPSSPLLQKVGAQHSLFSSPTYVIHSKLFTPLGWALLTKVDDINLGYGWLFVEFCQGLGDGFGWSLASKMKKGRPNNQIAIYQNYSSKAKKLTTPYFVQIEIFLYKSRSLNMNLKKLHQYLS